MSLNDPNVKKVTITSEVAESLSPKAYEEMAGGASEKTKTRKRKGGKKIFTGGQELIVTKMEKEKENGKTEGGGTSPGTLDQLASSHVPGSEASKAIGIASRFTADSAPVGKLAPSSGSELTGGGAKVKVVLSKTHKKSKVILGPAKVKLHAANPSKYKKTVKKLNVNISGLTRKLHKAKRIHNGVTKQTLGEVKRALEKAGLIKEDSKAPEDILRRMYSDYMVLKKRAL